MPNKDIGKIHIHPMRILLFIIILLITKSICAQNALDLLSNNGSNAVSPHQAIQVSDYSEKNKLITIWDIPKGFYLYKNQFKFKLFDAPNAQIGKISYPDAVNKNDPNLGLQLVYYNQAVIEVPIFGQIESNSKLTAYYQGCDGKICLPIQKQEFNIVNIKPKPLSESIVNKDETETSWGFLHLLTFLGLGILLSFTPCILPMIPIISGVVIGANTKKRSQNFLLSLFYVLGMSVTYMIIGLVIASLGASFQSLLQSPPFIITGTVIFILLALSMFSRFNLQLPNFIRMKLHNVQEKQKHGSIIGAFIMGVIATAVVSPCTSAPLIGILSYIAQTGDHLYGALSLFLLAIGMGIPLIIIATGFSWLVPKAGNWMIFVKNLFGILMLAVAIWLLSRIITEIQTQFLVSLLITISALVFWFSSLRNLKKKINILVRSVSMIALAYGTCLFIGTMLGHKSYFSPLSPESTEQLFAKQNDFYIEVDNLKALNQVIYQANMEHKRVLLDYYASWCSECHQLEKELTTPQVQNFLEKNHIQPIKVNVTKYSDASSNLLKEYNVLGLPTIILLINNQNIQKKLSGKITSKDILEINRKNYDQNMSKN